VQGGGHATPAGLLWAVGALAGEVCFSLLAAPLLPVLGPVRVSAWACALAVPQLAVAAAVTGEYRHLRAPTPTETTALLYLTVVLTVGAFLAWYGGVRRLGVERAGVFAGLIPVASLAGAALLDRAVPNPAQLAGTAAVALALVTALRQPTQEPAARRSASRTASA
jgi:drug/metabolite transporter (DMT)-like permease